MNNEFPIEQLKSLSSIRPDPVFLKWSKRAIFTHALPQRHAVPWHTYTRQTLTHILHPIALAGTLSAVVILGITTIPTGSGTVASLNGVNIATEQTQVAAASKTAQTRYFKGISPTISLALTDIIDPSTDYGSADHIKKGIALLTTKN